MNRRSISSRACRGLIITDVVIGLSILSALLAITAITVGQNQRNTRETVVHRQLTFEAEAALLALQANKLPDPLDDPAIALVFTENHGDAPDGTTWVTVRASKGKQSTELIGLAPENALKIATRPDLSAETGGQP